jgi:hypothetical protein
MATSHEFEWQSRAVGRKSGPLLAAVILAACAAAGAALSWVVPFEKLIVAIERNGVPPPLREASYTAAGDTDAVMIGDPAPAEKRQPPPAPKVVLINPGTTPTAAPEEITQAGKAERNWAANATLPPTARHRNTGDRAVLVIVRRRGAPFDTRVLRGRINNGRLIVDSRDRRGINIR